MVLETVDSNAISKRTGTLDSVRPVLGETVDDTAGILPLRLAAAASAGKKKESLCTVLQSLSGITMLLHPLNNPPFGKESEKNRIRKTENVTADFRTVHRIPLTKCRKNDTITTIICMFRQNLDMLSVRKFLMGGSV